MSEITDALERIEKIENAFYKLADERNGILVGIEKNLEIIAEKMKEGTDE